MRCFPWRRNRIAPVPPELTAPVASPAAAQGSGSPLITFWKKEAKKLNYSKILCGRLQWIDNKDSNADNPEHLYSKTSALWHNYYIVLDQLQMFCESKYYSDKSQNLEETDNRLDQLSRTSYVMSQRGNFDLLWRLLKCLTQELLTNYLTPRISVYTSDLQAVLEEDTDSGEINTINCRTPRWSEGCWAYRARLPIGELGPEELLPHTPEPFFQR